MRGQFAQSCATSMVRIVSVLAFKYPKTLFCWFEVPPQCFMELGAQAWYQGESNKVNVHVLRNLQMHDCDYFRVTPRAVQVRKGTTPWYCWTCSFLFFFFKSNQGNHGNSILQYVRQMNMKIRLALITLQASDHQKIWPRAPPCTISYSLHVVPATHIILC